MATKLPRCPWCKRQISRGKAHAARDDQGRDVEICHRCARAVKRGLTRLYDAGYWPSGAGGGIG